MMVRTQEQYWVTTPPSSATAVYHPYTDQSIRLINFAGLCGYVRELSENFDRAFHISYQ